GVFEKMKDVQDRFGPEPDSRNWKEKLIDEGMQYVPGLLDLAGKAFGRGQYQAQPAAQQQPQSRPTAPATPPPGAQPQQQNPGPAQNQAPGAQQMPPQNPDPEVQFLIGAFSQRGGDFVLAFASDPTGGADLAETLDRYAHAA